MFDTVLSFLGTPPSWFVYVATAIASAAGVSTIVPSVPQDKYMKMASKAVDIIGLNFGKAKNADAEPTRIRKARKNPGKGR